MVFGAMMAMMGMLPMIASLVGSSSALVGFLVHKVIGAAFSGPMLMSLVGHLVYGLVTGLGFAWFTRR